MFSTHYILVICGCRYTSWISLIVFTLIENFANTLSKYNDAINISNEIAWDIASLYFLDIQLTENYHYTCSASITNILYVQHVLE